MAPRLTAGALRVVAPRAGLGHTPPAVAARSEFPPQADDSGARVGHAAPMVSLAVVVSPLVAVPVALLGYVVLAIALWARARH